MTEAQRLAEEASRFLDSLYARGTCTVEDKRLYDRCAAAIEKLASMIPASGLAEEARDAARYRHLTDVHGPRSELCFDGNVCAGKAEFDAMIDASIAALSAPTPQQEQPR